MISNKRIKKSFLRSIPNGKRPRFATKTVDCCVYFDWEAPETYVFAHPGKNDPGLAVPLVWERSHLTFRADGHLTVTRDDNRAGVVALGMYEDFYRDFSAP